jgi:2-succinyl-5-enolpyruvyl-6-hydroxy-3-cyclohexene-1-carboxylate synthase
VQLKNYPILQFNSIGMSQGKEQIGRLAEILYRKGIRNVVVSPGSRNAPVIIGLFQSGLINLISVADERSAGFFAIGIAQQLNETVALLCTSGSAAVNYGPAVSEAYYQKLPLLVITADRPVEWIDQGDGQTIRQSNLFANFIRKSYNLPEDTTGSESRWYFDRTVCEAADRCRYPAGGPVHLNLPMAEPLYEISNASRHPDIRLIGLMPVDTKISPENMHLLAEQWNSSQRKLILAGQMVPDEKLQMLVRSFADDPSTVVLTETISNLPCDEFVQCIDRVIEGMEDDISSFLPEILVTIGGAVVSKKVKSLFRKFRPQHHWNINPDPVDFHLDTYQSLTVTIPCQPVSFLRELAEFAVPGTGTFRDIWAGRNRQRREKHQACLDQAAWSDLKAYDILFANIPDGSHIHLANSTPVRYAQLFESGRNYVFWSNRGTSGIDGCVSTAAGAAYASKQQLTVITGDIGFFYDSNALWNRNLTPNLRIVLINNGGGNIFRILPGPDQYDVMEPFLETSHSLNARGLAENFGVTWYSASDAESLTGILPLFYAESPTPALLEIFTPAAQSAEILRNYFKYIKS